MLLIVGILLAVEFDRIATDKGYDSGYGWWVFFTGIFGMIMVAALPDRAQKNIVVKDSQKTEPKPEELPEI